MQRTPALHALGEDSLDVYLAQYGRRSQAVYLMVVVLVLCGIVALPLIRVSVTVAGAGIIRPMLEKHEVRARVSGVAARVDARRGASVRRGEALIAMDSESLDGRVALLARQLAERTELRQDLETLTGRRPRAISSDELRTPRYREERHQLLRELTEHRIRSEQAARELARVNALAERGLVSAQETEEHRYFAAQLAAERELMIARRVALWEAARLEVEREIGDLEGRLAELHRERELFAVAAPVSGTIDEMSSVAAGSFVQAGEVVAVISPDAELYAEVYLPPADVGLLRIGMPARLHIDAFSYHDWGYLAATVTDISDDYLLVEGMPMFRIEARLEERGLVLPDGFRGEIRKGMTLQARFLVTERTLLQLLRDDVNDWVHPWHEGSRSAADAG